MWEGYSGELKLNFLPSFLDSVPIDKLGHCERVIYPGGLHPPLHHDVINGRVTEETRFVESSSKRTNGIS